jgi:hypothetical protein
MQNVTYARENKLLMKESNAIHILGEKTALYHTSKVKRMYFKVNTSERDDYIPLSFVSLAHARTHTHTHTHTHRFLLRKNGSIRKGYGKLLEGPGKRY